MSKEREALKLALEALDHLISEFRINDLPYGSVGYTKGIIAIRSLQEALAQPTQDIDWKDMYEKKKKKAEMWIAKYEKDIGPLEKAVPVAQPARGPILGTKTWVEDGKFITQNLYHSDLYLTPPAAQPPSPPPECKTEAEQIAYAFGWWKALEWVRTEQVADAARYQHIKGMARAMSLDIRGNHCWYMGLQNIRGPSLDEAIDQAIEAKLKKLNK